MTNSNVGVLLNLDQRLLNIYFNGNSISILDLAKKNSLYSVSMEFSQMLDSICFWWTINQFDMGTVNMVP